MALNRTTYNSWADDSGLNLDGTSWNKSDILNGLIVPIDTAYGGNLVTTTATGTQNDYNIDTIGATTGGIILCNNASLLTLTGLNNTDASARYIVLISIGAGQVDLSTQDTGSSAANRIVTGLSTATAKLSLAAGVGRCGLVYDTTNSRWRVLWHEQGDYIDYGGTSTITGWSSRTTTVIRYHLRGRVLNIQWELVGTSNATTVSFTLPYTSAAFNQYGSCGQVTDSGTVATGPGLVRMTASGTTVQAHKDMAGAVWTNSGSKSSIGQLVVQII